MLLSLSVPAANERGPQFAEHALKLIHQANVSRLPVALEYAWHNDRVLLVCRVADDFAATVRSQLYAQYPEAKIETLADNALDPPPTYRTHRRSLVLVPDLFELQERKAFDDIIQRFSADPVASLFRTLHPDRGQALQARVTLTLRPASRRRVVLQRLRFFWYRLTRSLSSLLLDVPSVDLHSVPEKLDGLLFSARLTVTLAGPSLSRKRRTAKFFEIAAAFGAFVTTRHARFRLCRRPRSFLLTTAEAAGLSKPGARCPRPFVPCRSPPGNTPVQCSRNACTADRWRFHHVGCPRHADARHRQCISSQLPPLPRSPKTLSPE